MAKMEEKVVKELAKKYDYSPSRIKDLLAFMRVVHEFSQYLANNQYYSEGLNKKIFLLNLDADACLLKIEKLKLTSEKLCAEVEKSMLGGGKGSVSKEEFGELKKALDDLERDMNEIHARSLQLTDEIRAEYKQKL